MKKQKAVFLDRDGVINEALLRGGKLFSPRLLEELRLVPAAKPVLKDLASSGYLLILVTNQPDIARNLLTTEILEAMHDKMIRWLGKEVIGDIRICPHLSEDRCLCRKPSPGMLLDAATQWGIDLEDSFIIGDRDVDMEAGFRANCKTVLIDRPYNQGVRADYRAKDIRDACRWIKSVESRKKE